MGSHLLPIARSKNAGTTNADLCMAGSVHDCSRGALVATRNPIEPLGYVGMEIQAYSAMVESTYMINNEYEIRRCDEPTEQIHGETLPVVYSWRLNSNMPEIKSLWSHMHSACVQTMPPGRRAACMAS